MPLAILISMFGHLGRGLELLFFLPQYMLAFIGAVHRTSFSSIPAFTPSVASLLSISLWTLVMFLYAWSVRKRSLWISVFSAPLVILSVTIALNLLLKACGISVALDGP